MTGKMDARRTTGGLIYVTALGICLPFLTPRKLRQIATHFQEQQQWYWVLFVLNFSLSCLIKFVHFIWVHISEPTASLRWIFRYFKKTISYHYSKDILLILPSIAVKILLQWVISTENNIKCFGPAGNV